MKLLFVIMVVLAVVPTIIIPACDLPQEYKARLIDGNANIPLYTSSRALKPGDTVWVQPNSNGTKWYLAKPDSAYKAVIMPSYY